MITVAVCRVEWAARAFSVLRINERGCCGLKNHNFKRYITIFFLNQSEIFARIKSSDPTVFSEIVEHWQSMLYNTAISIVQNEEDAEDVTQEVFLKVYEGLKRFRNHA